MISEMQLFSDMFVQPERQDKPAIVFEDEVYTYGDVRRSVELCASDLMRRGVRPGDHVALWAYNSTNWIIAMMATVRLGAVSVLVNYGMPVDFAVPLIQYTDTRFLIYGLNRDTHRDPMAGENLAQLCGIEGKTYNLIGMDFKARLDSGEAPDELPEEVREPGRTSLIIFTTGTTALPKAVMLSQQAILNNICSTEVRIRDLIGDGVCAALPLFHSYGLTTSFTLLWRGGTIYLISRLKPEEIIRTVGKYHTQSIVSVGILYLGILSDPRFKTEVAPYARLCIIGGEPANPQQIIRAYQAYPQVAFLVGYGQTEASPIISLNKPYDEINIRAYTVGKPTKGTFLRIVDDRCNEVEPGNVGEVLVKSDSLMNGYYKLPPEKQAIDKDGWLHTGDLGVVNEDGYLRLVGRSKDIIIVNGENISPGEIEEELRKIEGVKDARVLGEPHPLSGEEIEACLTMMEGFRFDENAIRTHLMKVLIKIKVPAHIFAFDAFPLHDNGKLNTIQLREMLKERLNAEAQGTQNTTES